MGKANGLNTQENEEIISKITAFKTKIQSSMDYITTKVREIYEEEKNIIGAKIEMYTNNLSELKTNQEVIMQKLNPKNNINLSKIVSLVKLFFKHNDKNVAASQNIDHTSVKIDIL